MSSSTAASRPGPLFISTPVKTGKTPTSGGTPTFGFDLLPTSPLPQREGCEEIATPLDRGINILSSGNYPREELERIQRIWSASNVSRTPLNSPSSQFPGSPITLEPVGRGATRPFFLTVNGSIGAVVKIHQTEPGSARMKRTNAAAEDFHKQKTGFPPGTGAYVDFICGLYIREQLKKLEPELSSLFDVPDVAYAQMGHHAFNFNPRDTRRPPPVRGTGLIAKYMPNSRSLNFDDLNKLDRRLLEILASLDIALGNGDRNNTNILLQEGRVVSIDHACCLPEEGLESGNFCWSDCEALQVAPSDRIVSYIRRMGENDLETLDERVSSEIQANLDRLPESQRRGEVQKLGPSRIIPHKIALCFLKKSVERGWSFSRIGAELLTLPPRKFDDQDAARPRTTLLHRLYNQVTDEPVSASVLSEKIDRVCESYFNSISGGS